MKTHFVIFSLLAGAAANAAPPEIWCGTPPLTAVAQQIGAGRVRAYSFMSGAQDPCVYAPTPKAVARAQQADLFVSAGMPFERTVVDRLAALNPALQILDTSTGVADNGDPHIWMSLMNLYKIADDIAQALVRMDPDGADVYAHNLEEFRARLVRLHSGLERRLEPFRGMTFYAYHPVLGHFADDYGLIQKTVELDGKSPSPKQLLELINRARFSDVRVVFVQPQFNERPARILAERIGGQAVTVNPLADDPVAVIEQVAECIAEAYDIRKTHP